MTIDPYDPHWRMSEEGKALKALEKVKNTTLMAYFKLNEEGQEGQEA